MNNISCSTLIYSWRKERKCEERITNKTKNKQLKTMAKREERKRSILLLDDKAGRRKETEITPGRE